MTIPKPGRPPIHVGLLLCLAGVLGGCDVLTLMGIPTPPTDPPRASPSSTPPSPTPVPSTDPADRSLGLAAIGDFPPELVAALASFYWRKYGIDVEILLPLPLDKSALDPERNQFVAEDLVASLARSYPKPKSKQARVIIGLISEDVYIRSRPDWHWAFGVRGDSGYAVVSTARMGSLAEPVPPIVMSRLRKMVTRDIDVMYFGLPLNNDRNSVLYLDILGLDDLDRMDEEDCGLDCALIGSTTGRRAFASSW